MDEQRRRAYRYLKVGIRYRKNEYLSFLTIGLQRDSDQDLRLAFRKLHHWMSRAGVQVEYFAVWVQEPDRVHVHIIWNAPFIEQRVLLDKMEGYLGEQCSVFIQGVKNDKVVRYVMQYQVNQGKEDTAKLRFSHSRGWLPLGYNAFWKALKHDFFKKSTSYDYNRSEQGQFAMMTQYSQVWWDALLVEVNNWIDEQSDVKKCKLTTLNR